MLERPAPSRRNAVPSASRFKASRATRKMRSASWVGASSEALRVLILKPAVLSFSTTVRPPSASALARAETRSHCRQRIFSSSEYAAMFSLKVVSDEIDFISPDESTGRLSCACDAWCSHSPVLP